MNTTQNDFLNELLDDSNERENAVEGIEKRDHDDAKTTPATPKKGDAARITSGNIELLNFIGRFPAATVEALSLIQERQENRFTKGGLRSTGGIAVSVRKLKRLGVVDSYRDPETGTGYLSLTKSGLETLDSLGVETSNLQSLSGIAKTRARHYSAIAHAAAQFISPAGIFTETLGIDPVAGDDIVSELAMRRAFDPVKTELKALKKTGKGGDFGRYREETIKTALRNLQAGRLEPADILNAYPVLYTLGAPQREGSKRKAVHQPDLAIRLDGGRKSLTHGTNILVEVELSKKSWNEYNEILATFAAELKLGFIYDRIIYFTIGTQVETLLKKVDRAGEYSLFKSGKLTVQPLTHRDGTPFKDTHRIRLAS